MHRSQPSKPTSSPPSFHFAPNQQPANLSTKNAGITADGAPWNRPRSTAKQTSTRGFAHDAVATSTSPTPARPPLQTWRCSPSHPDPAAWGCCLALAAASTPQAWPSCKTLWPCTRTLPCSTASARTRSRPRRRKTALGGLTPTPRVTRWTRRRARPAPEERKSAGGDRRGRCRPCCPGRFDAPTAER